MSFFVCIKHRSEEEQNTIKEHYINKNPSIYQIFQEKKSAFAIISKNLNQQQKEGRKREKNEKKSKKKKSKNKQSIKTHLATKQKMSLPINRRQKMAEMGSDQMVLRNADLFR